MMDPRRKSAAIAQTAATSLRKRAAARTTAGRWSLLSDPILPPQICHPERSAQHAAEGPLTPPGAPSIPMASSSGWVGSQDLRAAHKIEQAIAHARLADAALDAHARILLCRYGVLFRELLTRESNAPKWRDLLPILRRLEARGEIRGGRFVSGPFGEQYALPEAVDSLRKARNQHAARATEPAISVAAADPLNLVGILLPGDRIPAIPGREVTFLNGAAINETPAPESPAKPARTRSIAAILRAEALPPRPAQPTASPGLFS
jgi:ATP-dependent Lhr-like helicase